ncbi:MAG: hypothetical protein WD270_02725 [Acetobacterales bacterium]
MADPADLERQLQRFRDATRLKDEALRLLAEVQETQAQRWVQLRRVVDLAGDQYVSMRIDTVEESIRDQGAPLWLSCLLHAGAILLPLGAAAGVFVVGLTRSTQRMLTASDRATLEFTEELLALGHKMPALTAAAVRIPQEIIRTELAVAKFARLFEPELAATLRTAAHKVADVIGSQPFRQEAGKRRFDRTDAPLVAVKRSLHDWIDAQVRAETAAARMTREETGDLFEIATSPEPRKAAEEVAKQVAKRQAARARAVPLGGTQQGTIQHIPQPEPDKLPKTHKHATERLTKLRDRLNDAALENDRVPEASELHDLQLLVEAAIWASTYDFTPRTRRENLNRDDPKVRQYWVERTEPAPLPSALWKKLVERYPDPDEKKSFKDAGRLQRLGTVAEPAAASRDGWSPEVRLSHYFSRVLYPQIARENGEMVRRFGALRGR